MKPHISDSKAHFLPLGSAKAHGRWCTKGHAAFGWTKCIGDRTSGRERSKNKVTEAGIYRSYVSGHLVGLRSGVQVQDWRKSAQLCGCKRQKHQIIVAEPERKCIAPLSGPSKSEVDKSERRA